jgi:hypothetical protein
MNDFGQYCRIGKDRFPSNYFFGGYFNVFSANGVGDSFKEACLIFLKKMLNT